MAQSVAPTAFKHGQHIFVYNNIRTNQVVYSLTRSLNNAASLKQLPFLGKNTVPASLRKDLWTPLLHISFPHPSQGLLAYRKLREFRRLHETSYDLSLITQRTGPHAGQLMSTKSRGRVLMDQKANTVADVAAVLLQQERPVVPKFGVRERRKKMKGGGKPNVMGTVEGVRVRWADVLDAEFAATWPEAVVHDVLARGRYTATFPAMEVVEGREGGEEGVEGRGGGEEGVQGREGGQEGAERPRVL